MVTPCEAFENFPPGLPGRTLALASRLPGGLKALVQPLRLRVLRRLPFALGWMAKRPIPHEVTDAWLEPLLGRRRIRRDLTRYLRTARAGDMVAAAEGLRRFDRPALVVWAAEDRVMPPDHGRRQAELLPRGQLVELPDSYTLIPEDQPGPLPAVLLADGSVGRMWRGLGRRSVPVWSAGRRWSHGWWGATRWPPTGCWPGW